MGNSPKLCNEKAIVRIQIREIVCDNHDEIISNG